MHEGIIAKLVFEKQQLQEELDHEREFAQALKQRLLDQDKQIDLLLKEKDGCACHCAVANG